MFRGHKRRFFYKLVARRVSLGLAGTGTISGNGSADLFIGFSTANPNAANPDQITHEVQTIPNDLMDPLFAGVVQATEEAVVNALVDNHSMTGRDNHHVDALPHDRLRALLKKYNGLGVDVLRCCAFANAYLAIAKRERESRD